MIRFFDSGEPVWDKSASPRTTTRLSAMLLIAERTQPVCCKWINKNTLDLCYVNDKDGILVYED